ncbi:GTP cyclohydrolase I FolE [Nocardia elegans]|uniref:GTP cyclohydrolase 1 n=1 Tax=Nocardia elegans TaxID=300029 RepID=A0ABW6T5Y5_9NOCA|nr:GTP cyclohydrolase I FolE [Nocardia elegans]
MSANNSAPAGSDSASGAGAAVVAEEPAPIALGTGRPFDQKRAESAVRELLVAVGEDPDRPGLIDTPARVARAYREMFAGLYVEPDSVLNTTFDEGHQELVLVRDIPMYSTCEHHLVSFHGVAHVGYIPGPHGRVTGLSKLARLVDLYAKRPQVQERLTSQIADAVMRKLDPRGAIVVVEAEHLCMAMRGIRKPGASTTTSAVRGLLQTNASSRAEALDLILRK